MEYLDHNAVLKMLPDRNPESHKGDYGKVLLLCGSRGYTGAAALAALGALRTGSGLVYLGVPESIYQIEAIKLLEPIVFPMMDKNCMFAPEEHEIQSNLVDKDAVLIGPGIGRSEGTFQAVKSVLKQFHGPVVLDADGINVVRQHKDILRERTSPTIFTPHEGEFLRLYGKPITNRIECAKELANELGAVILLKGHRTVITDGAKCYINQTGNPGMAVGGSGDILAGMIVSLLGQGIAPIEAAACAAYLHGAAGDICAEQIGQYGMLPSDMLNVLPRLLK